MSLPLQSQARTVPSSDALTIAFPDEVKQMAVTPPVCSLNVTKQKPVAVSQTLTGEKKQDRRCKGSQHTCDFGSTLAFLQNLLGELVSHSCQPHVSLSLSLSLFLSFTHSLSLSLFLFLSFTYSHTLSLSFTYTHNLSLSLSLKRRHGSVKFTPQTQTSHTILNTT